MGTINIFSGTPGNDNLVGTIGTDLFLLEDGGDDTAFGDEGNDDFRMGGALNTLDAIDGGGGYDVVRLNGDYLAELVFGPATLTNIEEIRVQNGFFYTLVSDDATVAAGQTLLLDASKLDEVHDIWFDGSAETDGNFHFIGGGCDDRLIGGDGNDSFHLQFGDNDTADGRRGDDAFYFGAEMTGDDNVNGGLGHDTVHLNGISTVTCSATTMVGVENLILEAANYYFFATHDATVVADKTLTVDGSAVKGRYQFDGSTETDGRFHFLGSRGDDELIGGAGRDRFEMSKGHDVITGGGGADNITCGPDQTVLVCRDASESNGTAYDTIRKFNANQDGIDVGFAPAAFEGTLGGNVSAATFDSDMGTAINDNLGASAAILIDATGGDLAGRTFLVVDTNGDAGYTAGLDHVFDITGYKGTLSLANFLDD